MLSISHESAIGLGECHFNPIHNDAIYVSLLWKLIASLSHNCIVCIGRIPYKATFQVIQFQKLSTVQCCYDEHPVNHSCTVGALIVKTFIGVCIQQTMVVSLWAAHLKSLLAVCMGLYVSPECPWGPPEQETRGAGETPSSVSSHVTQTDCYIKQWPWLLKMTSENTAKTWNLHRPHARMQNVKHFNTKLWFKWIVKHL